MSEEPSSNPWDKVFKANKPAATPTPSSTPTPAQPASQPLAPITPKAPENPKANTTPFSITPNAIPQSTPTASQPVNTEAPKAPILSEPEFDFSDAQSSAQIVMTIYGHKGHGKTKFVFSLPGKIVCLSFDNQSKPIHETAYNNDPRIVVKDAVRYLDESDPHAYLDTAEYTFRYINQLLDKIAQDKPDWIVLDATEILQQICEMTMRSRNGLGMSQGISNLNLWKERGLYMRQIHRKAVSACKRGLIYTTYVDKDEIIRDGDYVQKVDRPKWTEHQLRESSIVIRVLSVNEQGGRRFYAEVESSKSPLIKTGLRVDVTDRGFDALGIR